MCLSEIGNACPLTSCTIYLLNIDIGLYSGCFVYKIAIITLFDSKNKEIVASLIDSMFLKLVGLPTKENF